MTIFRVNIDRDLATIAKKGPKRIKDKELEKALKEFQGIKEMISQLREMESYVKINVQAARKIYSICDKRLKEKGLSKDDKGELVFIRKKAYDFTMQMKKLGFI